MPQIYFKNIKTPCDADLFFWHIKESCDELSELIADGGMLLAEAQRKFKSTARQREWLATRALLQQTPHKGQDIFYHTNGQPFLTSGHISISHTNDYVAIAISQLPIGIDIELSTREALPVAKAFLQPQELEELTAKEALNLWVTKEAAFKFAPQKATSLKDICVTKNGNNYIITYPDGTTAECAIYPLDNIILSLCFGQQPNDKQQG